MDRDDLLCKLNCMGYYGYCDEEDERLDYMSLSELQALYDEKLEEMEEEIFQEKFDELNMKLDTVIKMYRPLPECYL